MRGHAPLMSSASDEWATPREFFAIVDAEFGPFDIDAAASRENALAPRYYTREDSALQCGTWGPSTWLNPPYSHVWLNPPYSHVWLNPPYSQVAAFMRRAATEGATNVVVCLVPARTDTRWWHESVSAASEVRLLKGRLKFGDGTGSAPFPSALVVYHPTRRRHLRIVNWDWRSR